MPPARQPDRVADPRQADLSREADGVVLGRPQRFGGNRLLDAKPVLARSAVAGPVQARVIREDLHPRSDDEDHQEQVEEVHRSHPDRQAGVSLRAGREDRPGVVLDEPLHRADATQALGGRHRGDQAEQPDREQPEQVEPPAAPHANPRSDAARHRYRSRPRRGIDDILAGRQLRPEAAHSFRRGVRRSGRGRLRGGGRIIGVSHVAQPPTLPRPWVIGRLGRRRSPRRPEPADPRAPRPAPPPRRDARRRGHRASGCSSRHRRRARARLSGRELGGPCPAVDRG